MRPKLHKIALVAGAVCCLVLITALAAISIFLNSDRSRDLALDHLHSVIQGRLRIGDHRVDLIAGRLVLSDVRLDDRRGEPVAEARRLQAQIRWLPLLVRAIHISRVTIEDPLLSLAWDARDRLELLDIVPGSNAPSGDASDGASDWQVRLDDLRVKNGQVIFDRPATKWSGNAHDIHVSAGGDLKRRTAQLRVSVGRAEGRFEETQGSVSDIVVSARYAPDRGRPIRLTLETARSNASAEGRLNLDADRPEATAVVEIDLDLAEIQPWLPADGVSQGRAKARMTLDGPLDDFGAALTLTLSDAMAWETPVRALKLDALLENRVVEIEGLTAEDEWGRIGLAGRVDLRPVFPSSFGQAAAGWSAALLQIDLKGQDIRPERITALEIPWDGVWQAQLRMQGDVGDAWRGKGQAEIDLSAADLKGPGMLQSGDGRLVAYLRWAGGRLNLDSCQANLDDTTLEAGGTLDWEQHRIDARATLRSDRIASLGALLDMPLPDGGALLRLEVEGTWDRPLARGALLAENLALDSRHLGRLLAEGALNPEGVLHIHRLALENRGSHVEGKGRLTLKDGDGRWSSDPGIEGDLDLANVQLSDFFGPVAVDASLNGRLRIQGSATHPRADLTLESSPVAWQDIKGVIDGRLLYDDGDLTVSALRLASGRSDIRLQGNLAFRNGRGGPWRADPIVQAEVNSTALHLADFGRGLEGTATLDAEVAGTLSRLRGAYRLTGRDLDLRDQKLAAVDLEGRLAEDTVIVDRMTVSPVAGEEIIGKGWYAFDRRFAAEAATEGFDVRNIHRLQTGGPVHGRLVGMLSADGTLDQPQMSGRLWLRQPRIHGQAWDDFRFDLDLREERLAIDADLTFALKADYHLQSGDFGLTAVLDRTDLAPYLALLADNRWQGRLSGRLHANGNVNRLETADAVVELSDGELRFRKARLISFATLAADLHDGVVAVPEARVRLMQDGDLKVSAVGPVDRDLAVRIDGVLPLAAVAPFSDAVADASGNARFQIQGRGALTRMTWQGEVALEEVGCRLVELGQTLHGLSGRLRVSPGQVSIETVSGRIGEGDFSMDGTVPIAGMQPAGADLRIAAHALPLVWPDTMEAKIGADLTLKGDARQLVLQGQVVLLEGIYYKDFKLNLLSALTETQRPEPLPAQWQAPEWMEKIRLDVIITHRYPLLVDNNVARLEIVPDLKLTGSVARPLLDGRAQVAEGEIIFRKKSFTVKRGVVDFVNPYRIEPILDIQAEARIREWLIGLSAQGTPQQLKVRLSSDPPESDANILSLIVFGQTSSEFSSNGGGGTTTGQMLAALVASTWGEDIQKETGLDILEVETGGDTQGEDRIELTVGKKLTSRLTLKYALESKNNQLVQRAISEYRLLEHMSASGFQDTAGNYGGELLFRIEFR
ncbi:translocation/assembly module TamB domain-containing protein [Desulfatitalea tepidiphila]|uniref:translocation/assembly module TamB domain-containing protein n=1 Tax=Desulfatitalea tepidiphila TaxID=1185843 RepID=UPI0006B5362E|nr:translocation/assembly module TamB domain-containing protein [Desulfatitalea tepidiphila]